MIPIEELDRIRGNLFDDWRKLLLNRALASGPERQELDNLYNRLLPDIGKISRSWANPDLSLICSCGRLLQDYFLGKLLPDIS